jgi:hypothetical protein
MAWTGCAWMYIYIYMGKGELFTKFWFETMKGRDHSEDLGLNERTILK